MLSKAELFILIPCAFMVPLVYAWDQQQGDPETYVICKDAQGETVQAHGDRVEVDANTVVVYDGNEKVALITNMECWDHEGKISHLDNEGAWLTE